MTVTAPVRLPPRRDLPQWERVPRRKHREILFHPHGIGTLLQPDFMWRLADAAVVGKALNDGPPLRLRPNNAIVVGYCHTARVSFVKRRLDIRCRNDSEPPPPVPTHVAHIAAFDFYESHWQHGIFDTLPFFGMAAPLLHAFPTATIVHHDLGPGGSGLLAVADFNASSALAGFAYGGARFRLRRLHDFVDPSVDRRSPRRLLVPSLAIAFAMRDESRPAAHSAAARLDRGLTEGEPDTFPRSAYWPYSCSATHSAQLSMHSVRTVHP